MVANMLIDQFIGYIQAEKRFSVLTVEAYQHDILQFAEFMRTEFEIEDLTQVKTTQVKSFIVHLKSEGLENRSINRKMSTLRTFYKYCLRENLMEKSPMTGVKALKQPKALVKFVTETDINKVSFGDEADFSSVRDHLLFEMLYQTGMRQAELRGLTDGDVDKTIELIRSLGCVPAIALKPATPAEAVFPYLDKLGMVLVMTVEPGFGGQSFMHDMMPKVQAVRAQAEKRGLDLDIQVDGGVNLQTAAICINAGANVLVAGSAVFGSPDPKDTILKLRTAAQN